MTPGKPHKNEHVFGIQHIIGQHEKEKGEHMEATAPAFAKYVANFIANRFPDGLPDKMVDIVGDIIVTAFTEGAEWADREAMRQDIMVAPRQIIINP